MAAAGTGRDVIQGAHCPGPHLGDASLLPANREAPAARGDAPPPAVDARSPKSKVDEYEKTFLGELNGDGLTESRSVVQTAKAIILVLNPYMGRLSGYRLEELHAGDR
jgi:hypothetical protein